MSSASLYFKNIIGQEKAKKLLAGSFRHGKMSHAFIFRGPDGVGKKRTALSMAALVNCQAPDPMDSCGNCSSCRKFQSDNHPDLLVIQPDGAAIKIDQIRDMKQTLTFPPFEARYRVIILEDVQTMKREAANSLLKTLEEPPPNNLLILTADEAGEVLPTIISRCQTIAFHPLPYDRVAQVLMENTGQPPETAATLAAVAEGSLGRALRLSDNNLLSLRREIIELLLDQLPGQAASIALVTGLAEKAAELKENLGELLSLLKIWLRDLALASAGGPGSLLISRDLQTLLPAAVKRWSLPQLFEKIALVNQAEKELLRNCNRAMVCEVLFFGLI